MYKEIYRREAYHPNIKKNQKYFLHALVIYNKGTMRFFVES